VAGRRRRASVAPCALKVSVAEAKVRLLRRIPLVSAARGGSALEAAGGGAEDLKGCAVQGRLRAPGKPTLGPGWLYL
jgi:hypothetical protein